jgi:hypothetical protein
MIDNFNLAISFAKGEYVTVIGDDDGLSSEIIDAVIWSKENGIEALTTNRISTYAWPDFTATVYGKSHAGKLYLGQFDGSVIFPDCGVEMRKCLQSGGQLFFSLPKSYYGFVKLDILKMISSKTGKYFDGTSPDMYSALTIANIAKRICVVDYPLFVPGASGRSGSGSSARGKHKGQLENIPHLSKDVICNWPTIVPRFYSVETVWAESAIRAIQDMEREDLVSSLNIPLLHAVCLVSHPDYFKLIVTNYIASIKVMEKALLVGLWLLISALFKVILQKAKHYLSRLLHPSPSHGAKSIDSLKDINEAVHSLAQYLDASGINFHKYINSTSRFRV